MSPKRTVVVTRRAERQISHAEKWWKDNRSLAPNAIREELDQVFALLSEQALIGVVVDAPGLHDLRRIHLARVSYDVYYRPSGDREVRILAFWHSRRGSRPPL